VIVAVEDICSGDEDYQDLVVFIENAKYFDLDGDDVWDAVDNCFSEDPFLLQTQIARLQNPAQANSDADPFGDSCDSCPTYPDGSDFLRDVLGDGSCPNQQEQLDPPAPCPPDGCALDATTTFLMPTTSVLPTTTNTVPRCVRLDPPCTPAVDGPLCVGGRLTLTNQIEEIAAQGPSDTLQFAAGDQVKNTIELATALNPGSTAPFSLLECQVCFEGAGVQPGTCIDGVDNDNDGEVDAADADCQTANPQELPDGVDAVGGCGGAGQPECAFAGRICSEPQLVFVTGDPAEGAQGCGPGFYKNDTQKREEVNWKPTGYSAADDFLAVFGAGPSITLLKALRQRGGGEAALLRQAVAALLNAAHPDVGYGLSEAQVTALFQNPAGRGGPEGLKDYFEALNERGCPLSARKTK
jgi:hypothetical protein